MRQWPEAFEFNLKLLKFLADEVYRCRFGTFLCNNEKEREEQMIRETTVSLWSYLNEASVKEQFTEPEYKEADLRQLVKEGYSSENTLENGFWVYKNLEIWREYYF